MFPFQRLMDFYFSSSHIFTSLAAWYNTFSHTFPFDKAFVSRLHSCLSELAYEQYIKYRQLKQHSVDLILKGMHSSRKSHGDQWQCWRIIVYSLHEFTGVCIFINRLWQWCFIFQKSETVPLNFLILPS